MTEYTITLSDTAGEGEAQYLQIISKDGFETNVVLIGKFELKDTRAENNSQ